MEDVTWSARTLLGRLAPQARADLLRRGVRRRYDSGDVLIHEGLPETHVVLLEDALAKVTALLPEGRHALIAIRVSGDIVGEMSALNDLPRSATVTVCRPSAIRLIGRDAFRDFLRRNADAAIEVAGIVADRLRAANRQRVDFASYPAKIRVARALAEIGASHGRRTPDGIAVDIEMTQSELATLCGAADVTVHKALHDLRAAKLIDTVYRGFVIRDPETLKSVARLVTR
ncbi:Crp/Fnr family transcriptional regulator [Actinoplanes teichomyceticus]|uniref:CRP-like cAMP-binding protein n=1 Tax=Actinoplanes teichomyceticus TaxID=1867 RepID=A0A561WB52_ACTTI|nr:Crp/Fnr family transcriptional regulator [Actinoplanes teichomyceticus]TWG21096.1 CRP-like cAMP-binding protein [Actinoplanes teichomyceticus]GIF14915.1 Crp/Fnr family transcriptional regulator [Actinoplanes teichomyceticus]